MFDTILIANRGEIACRVMRTARRMGIRSVAVYSDADADSLHVACADAAFRIGPAPARESYLSIAAILDAARRAGAQAVHPGYGFLSENADFAAACTAAGLVFIGPPEAAIRAMGSKAAAKTLMERSHVPLVPGYHGEEQSPATLRAAAGRIGYPLLIKASSGGGGKGMRIVADPREFDEALAMAQGEARSAFGDDRVLIEHYLTQPRHIEIQIFADTHGNVVSLFERDCSIQRRHQKVLEEAPAPGMTPQRRTAMGNAARAAASAIGYVGAGTVEFIVQDDAFYFMEMNTRLQVEHPVTEAITGLDLVEWQLRVAAGEVLPWRPEQLGINGHAIEVRIYAEDPARDFAPSIGVLRHLRMPDEDAHVRIDTGVREGDTIPIHYDPMIAKLIAWDQDRAAALRRLTRALEGCEIAGVRTNLRLLRAIAAELAAPDTFVDTGFIARHARTLLASPPPAPHSVLAAAIHRLLHDERTAVYRAPGDADPWSPWTMARAWRLNGDGYQDFVLCEGETTHPLRAHLYRDGGFRLDLPSGAVEVRAVAETGGRHVLHLDGARFMVRVLRDGDTLTLFQDGVDYQLAFVDPHAPAEVSLVAGGRVIAPMPGRVLEVRVAPKEPVARGAVLLVLEAMKVQMRITAPADGVVRAVLCATGDLVSEGSELVTFEENG